ncbi:MAG: polyprenyl synthetase family protein [Candidatus Omnitrophica bacterium]|nr:polyprenyl synthetase family protein [Candidatus Omnitrophota bacterium]
MDINKYIKAKKRLIDKALDRYLPSGNLKPQIIHKAMRYAVFPGGKRIRPIFTIASFEACGGKTNSILPVACAIELIHNYTLIHDDLPCMDNDEIRRGKLTCHKKFSESLALLAGDALLTLSFQLLSEAGNLDIIKEVSMAIGSRGTIGGQVVDIVKQKTELDYIASRKTGALFEAAVKAGGLFKGVDRKKIDNLANFGRLIGFTFQLIDDLIDKEGHVALYGAGYVEKRAALLTGKAETYLDIFGKKKAKRLLELSEAILQRQS